MRRKKKTLDTGVTQRTIVRRILDHVDGVSEPELRAHLEDRLGIKDLSNIKSHLQKLESEKIIQKEMVRGRPNKWGLSYDNPDDVSLYLIYEFLLNRFDEAERLIAIDVFNARATQHFLINTDWMPQIERYFINKCSKIQFDYPPLKLSGFLEMLFIPAIHRSPTLFCDLYEARKELEVITSTLLNAAKNRIGHKEYTKEEDILLLYQSTILSSFLIDMRVFPEQTGKISEFIRDMSKTRIIRDLFKDDEILLFDWTTLYLDAEGWSNKYDDVLCSAIIRKKVTMDSEKEEVN